MRRLPLTLLAALALAAPAQASEHNMRVNEVALSFGGNPGAQFIELLDPVDEPFPSPPYKLNVYDANGVLVGTVDLGNNATIVDKGTPMLVATPGVPNADRTFTFKLPANGQACFESSETATPHIHCMAWGTITVAVKAGYAAPTTTGPNPPDGKSLSLCPRGGAVVTATPKAANACPDVTKPIATVAAKTQKLGPILAAGYKFAVKSNEKGKAKAQLLRRGKVVATSTKSLSARVAKAFALRPAKATRDALAGAMTATFTLKVVVTDAAGNARTVTRPVTVKRT
jgi:hypothetical protein